MGRIVPIPWKQFERVLLRIGCEFLYQKGSHRVYWKQGIQRPIIVPAYKELPPFIIKNNLRILNVTNEEYLSILKDL
ncbi:MAG: type II toxin-antitoxin system HicA family toxin [Nitrospirae bacterium]|nr:type II toxin-antitoxin system HicA family toxin [Nitrospirota bacterium]